MKASDYSLGSRHWPGLSKLVEEAGEVCQVGGKILGNGGNPDHWGGTNLEIRMGEEVADLSAACRAFLQLNGYDGAPWVLEREIHKHRQFLAWHSENLADLPDDGPAQRGYGRLARFFGAGSDLHYQIFWAWRVYRAAMLNTMFTFMMLGFALGCVFGYTSGLFAAG